MALVLALVRRTPEPLERLTAPVEGSTVKTVSPLAADTTLPSAASVVMVALMVEFWPPPPFCP